MAHKGINAALATEQVVISSKAPNMSDANGNDGTGDEAISMRTSSRFQVARVNSQTDRGGSGDICEDAEHDSPQSGPGSPGGARFSISTNSNHTYDTSGKYDWRETTEAIPREAYYRNMFSTTPGLRSRPTLAELHEEDVDGRSRNREMDQAAQTPAAGQQETPQGNSEHEPPKQTSGGVKFGWIRGVFIRCLLNIWGVMLFIRLSWCVAQAGVLGTIAIILLSAVVTLVTTISMSAITTNGVVKGGGAYFLISRVLGPEFGGPIGLLFSLANAVAVAMYIVGFAETFVLQIFYPDTLLGFENDIRVLGIITICILLGISVCGMMCESVMQLILLVILLVAMLNFAIGSFIPATVSKASQGFTNYNIQTLTDNSMPAFRDGETFVSVFAVFFPAATGILAGANISGDLKDAPRAIPKGTLYAIVVTTVVYIVVAVMLGATVLREANGFIPSEVVDLVVNSTALPSTVGYSFTTESLLNNTTTFQTPVINASSYEFSMKNVANCSLVKDGCKYGLYHSYDVMKMVSLFGPLVTAGIFSATLSSALASLVSAPKVFQAVCQDNIFPKLHWFSVASGRLNTPYRAFAAAFIIGLGFTAIGDLNAIAPFISMFFLATYALINFACFDVALANPPGWRPAFRYHNKWLSLFGFVVCLVVMFLISWPMALLCVFIIGALFMFLKHVKPDVNWGSSGQAHVYRKALKFSLKLLRTEDHIKNYRPQVLVLSGMPENRPALVDLVSHITKNVGLMVCGNVIVGEQTEHLRTLTSSDAYKFFQTRKIKTFYNCTIAPNFRLGVQSLMQNTGIGKLRPNILMMGFKTNWCTDTADNVYQYFSIIHDAFDLQYGVGILRMKEGLGIGLDAGDATIFNDPSEPAAPPTDDELSSSDEEEEENNDVYPNGRYRNNGTEQSKSLFGPKRDTVVEMSPVKATTRGINTGLVRGIKQFNIKKCPKGTIDVWWLYDDGGLTLLIPHLLRQKAWKKCKFRIFVPGSKKGDLDQIQRELVGMVQKFRLNAELSVVKDVNKSPSEESMQIFHSLMNRWRLDEEKGETQEKFPWKSSRAEIELMADKTRRHVRVKEVAKEHSRSAALIVMSLPMPRKGTCSAGLYMAWLDMMTRDLNQPIMLLRGNQKSVLTFYT